MIPVDIPFWKMEGAGNDFVVFDEAHLAGWFADPAARKMLCDRHFGVGADGILVYRTAAEEGVDYVMDYYNRDGAAGSFCGNGARCLALYHFLRSGAIQARFRASDGLHDARWRADGMVEISLADVTVVERAAPSTYFLDTGSPHYVKILPGPPEFDFVSWARPIRHRFRKEGTNVNVVYEEGGRFRMRTFERGVEQETLACGTGAVAAAIALHVHQGGKVASPVELEARGGRLMVRFVASSDAYRNIWLGGPARVVFEGRWKGLTHKPSAL